MDYTIKYEGPCLHGHGKYRLEIRGDGFITVPPLHELSDILQYIEQHEGVRND